MARETFRIFLCKNCRIFDSIGNHKPFNAFHEWKVQKNKSNYKQTQIINHHWSISAFLELQESQTYCSRAPNNKLSQLFKQYHFSLQWSIVLWSLLTAIFDLHLCNQRCNVIVRSYSCIINEKKQNGGILRSPKRVTIAHLPVLKFPFRAIIIWKMEEGIDKLCLHFGMICQNWKFIPNVDG